MFWLLNLRIASAGSSRTITSSASSVMLQLTSDRVLRLGSPLARCDTDSSEYAPYASSANRLLSDKSSRFLRHLTILSRKKSRAGVLQAGLCQRVQATLA